MPLFLRNGKMEFFINGTVSGIKAAITDHLEMFFRDVPDKAFDKIHDRNGFLNVLIIFVTIVMERDKITGIRIDPGSGNDRATKIPANIFGNSLRVTTVGIGINIEAVFMFQITTVEMLSSQLKLNLSYYSDLYNMIVPKDHILRKIRELVDFSFIYDELKNKYCLDNGRNAKNPILLFKYLLLKYLYNLSDNGVVERSRYDMSFKYFLELTPEEEVIHPSLLTKFRKQRLKDENILDLLVTSSPTCRGGGFPTSASLVLVR